MFRRLLVIGFGIFPGVLGLSTSALAETKTVTLNVLGMYCDMRPVTVKRPFRESMASRRYRRGSKLRKPWSRSIIPGRAWLGRECSHVDAR